MENAFLERIQERLRTYATHSVDLMYASLTPHEIGLPEEFPPLVGLQSFQDLCDEFARILSVDGSLCLEVRNSWLPERPVRNPFPHRLLVHLCTSTNEGGGGWYLAQDLFRYEVYPLSPSQWRMVELGRPITTIFPVWWLSRTPSPKADNRRVLRPYSEAQKLLLRKGDRPGLRPSGHALRGTFGRENGGAIPSNLIAAPGVHIADIVSSILTGNEGEEREWSPAFLEFVIRLCTEKGGRVGNPFARSDRDRQLTEDLGRQWIAIPARE